jgi:hypothetical protein
VWGVLGDYGLGFCANSLALGCDCLGHIRYFDAVLNDSKGAPAAAARRALPALPACFLSTLQHAGIPGSCWN